MRSKTPDRPFARLLGAFPDIAALARALDLPHATVAAWKRRDSVPENRWRSIAQAATRLDVPGVSYERLSEASAQKAAAPATATARTPQRPKTRPVARRNPPAS